MINESDLSRFYGTESYHLYGNSLRYGLTDGALYLFKDGECFWLLDLIISVQYLKSFTEDDGLQHIQFWKLTVNSDQSCVVTCERDEGDVVYTQNIPYTDFPFSTRVWLQKQGHQFIVMLPSEY